MNPEALHTPNRDEETPFDRAVQRDNKIAIQLMRGKLSLDEITKTLVRYDKECPQALLDQLRSELSLALEPSLLKDIVGTVCEYFGLEELANTSNKKRQRQWGGSDSEDGE